MLTKNIRRYKIMEKHMECVRSGKYCVANNLLYLLRKGSLTLGCTDDDWETETILDDIGCPVTYSRNYYQATYKI